MSDPSQSRLPESRPRTTQRQRLLTLVGLAVVLGAIIWGVYWFVYLRDFESTDDAYVSGDVIAITSRESGTVLSIHADNTQSVKRGEILVELDPIQARIAMQAAEADLARTVRNVRALFAKAEEQQAQIEQARVQMSQAQSDLKRRSTASRDGAVSAEDLTHAHDALDQAKAALIASGSQRAQTLAQIQGADVANNPDVLAAEARLRAAAVTLVHMRLIAPVSGVVAQRSAEVGEQVSPGTPLMAVVPLANVWVDANFKEVQLKRMRVGQPVTLTADMYGGSITYHGRVAGLSAGSGSAFALLPPQNATGNWIKIVQRIPVRIELDRHDLERRPLRIGLSVAAEVDVHDQSGPLVSDVVRPRVPEDTTANTSIKAVDLTIARILADNGAQDPKP